MVEVCRTAAGVLVLDFQRLESFLIERYRTALTDADIAVRINVPRDSIRKLRKHGLGVWEADEIAIRLGVHPCRIWSDWWWV